MTEVAAIHYDPTSTAIGIEKTDGTAYDFTFGDEDCAEQLASFLGVPCVVAGTDPDSGLPRWLHRQIQTALGGDSNDAEHDALVSVAEHFGVEWTAWEDRAVNQEED